MALKCGVRSLERNLKVGLKQQELTSGKYNVAIGRKTGGLVCGGTGSNNISFGHQAGTSLVSGSSNVNIGTYAGMCVTTGTYNITLGHRAGCTIHTATKTISIGC